MSEQAGGDDLTFTAHQEVTPVASEVVAGLRAMLHDVQATARALPEALNNTDLGKVEQTFERFENRTIKSSQAIRAELQKLHREYDEMAKARQIPDVPFTVAAAAKVRQLTPAADEALLRAAGSRNLPVAARDISLSGVRQAGAQGIEAAAFTDIRRFSDALRTAHDGLEGLGRLVGTTSNLRAGTFVPKTVSGLEDQTIRDYHSQVAAAATALKANTAATNQDTAVVTSGTGAKRTNQQETISNTAAKSADTQQTNAAGAGAGGSGGRPPQGPPAPPSGPPSGPSGPSGPQAPPGSTQAPVASAGTIYNPHQVPFTGSFLDQIEAIQRKFAEEFEAGIVQKFGRTGFDPRLPRGQQAFSLNDLSFRDPVEQVRHRNTFEQETARVEAQRENYQRTLSRQGAGDSSIIPFRGNIIDTRSGAPIVSRVVEQRQIPASATQAERILGLFRDDEERKARTAAERENYERAQARRAAGDTTLAKQGKIFVDTSGLETTFSKLVGQNRLRPATREEIEGLRTQQASTARTEAERENLTRTQSRLNDPNDPSVSRIPGTRFVSDTSGATETIAKLIGRDRLSPATPEEISDVRAKRQAEAQKAIDGEHAAAQKLVDAAHGTAQRENDKRTAESARETIRQEQRRTLTGQRERLDSGDSTIQQLQKFIVDRGGPTPTYSRIVDDQHGERSVPATEGEIRQIHELEAAEAQLTRQREILRNLDERLASTSDTVRNSVDRRGNTYLDKSDAQNINAFRVVRDPKGDRAEQLSVRETEDAIRRLNRVREQEALAANTEAQSLRHGGVVGNFLGGLSSSGIGSKGPGGLDIQGLAQSAGNTVKYSTLYNALNLVQTAAAGVVGAFLDADDSVTELQVAMGKGAEVTGAFQNSLQDVAALGGFNVGEAMDVAASGIRAFSDETKQSDQQINALGTSFATNAARIAVLSNTTLTDAAGNLKAITAGFNLPATFGGFGSAADAIAGAKLIGGGDEKQIGQGLANSALTFKELGFSLRESAVLISKINAETDQGGTLIASRISRLGSILSGTTGRTFIQGLNQQLAGQKDSAGNALFVDSQASARDQLIQLAKAYQTVDAAQKRTIVSALGGTAQTRELIITLQSAGLIAGAEANKKFDNAALVEFQKRLENVRAQLNVISGNVQGIVTNIARSGLFDPVIAGVEALKGATDAAKALSQVFNVMPHQILGAVSSVAVLATALTVLARVRSAGGVAAFAASVESRLLPVQSLARQQLARDAELRGRVTRLSDAGGGTFAAALEHGGGLREDRARLLAKAQENLNDLRSDHSRERALVPAGSDQRAELVRTQTEEIAAQQSKITNLQREIKVLGDINARDALRAKEFVRLSRPIDKAEAAVVAARDDALATNSRTVNAARKSGNNAAEEVALAERVKIETTFNARLAAFEAQRLAAEGRAIAIIAAGSGGGVAPGTGIVGAAARQRARVGDTYTAARDAAAAAGSGRAGAALKGAGAVGAGAVGGELGGSVLLDAIGGIPGLIIGGVIAAVTGVSQLYGQRNDVNDLITGLNQQLKAPAANEAPREFSITEFRNEADTFKATADELKSQQEAGIFGIVGKLGELLSGGKAKSGEDIASAQKDIASNNADAIAAGEAKDARARSFGGAGSLGSLIDTTSADTVKKSFTELADAGRNANTRLLALREAIDKIGGAAGDATKLSNVDRAKVADAAALAGSRVQFAAPNTAGYALTNGVPPAPPTPGHPSGTPPITAPALGTDPVSQAALHAVASVRINPAQQQGVANTLRNTILTQLGKGTDPTSTEGKKTLGDALTTELGKTYSDPKKIKTIVDAALKSTEDEAKSLATAQAAMDAMVALATQAIQDAQAAGAETTTKTSIADIQGGKFDDSAVVGATRTVAEIQSARDLLVAKFKAEGKSDTEINAALENFDASANQAVLSLIQARIANNQKLFASLQNRRNRLLNLTPSTGAKTNQVFDQQEAQGALSAHDKDTLTSILSGADAGTVAGIKTKLDNKISSKQKEIDDFVSHRSLVGDLPKLKRELADLLGQRSTLQSAQAEVVPPATQSQIDASTASANAAISGDKILTDRATLQGAQADLEYAQLHQANDARAIQQALQRVNEARRTLLVDTAQRAIDVAHAADFSENRTAAARKALEEAQAELARINAAIKAAHAKGDKAGESALRDAAKIQAGVVAGKNFDEIKAQLEDSNDVALQAIDRTNPIEVARKKAELDQQLYDKAKKQPGIDQASLDRYKNAAQASTANLHLSETEGYLSDLKTQDDLQQISHARYIQGLGAERSRLQARLKTLKFTDNEYKQTQDLINKISLDIKSAANQLSGQFNLGDIKVPTVYEVRRSILSATGAATEAAVHAASNNATNNTTININGADLAAVDGIMRKYIGNVNRFTPATRKA